MKSKRKKLKAKARARVAPIRPHNVRKPENPRRLFMKSLLGEWGRWRRSWHFGPRRMQSWWGKVILDRFLPMAARADERPIDEDRAQDTHDMLSALDPQLRLVLLIQFVIGGSKEEKSHACGLSPRGFYYALDRALDAFEIRTTLLSQTILAA